MPTTIVRAKKWIKSGKATPFYKKGVFCVRLNVKPSGTFRQKIAVGVDPGSKQEGFTIKSKAHTYLNVQSDAVTHVKKSVEQRSDARRARRYRNAPCRKPRFDNRNRSGFIPPSTKSRWDIKLRICKWFSFLFPVNTFVVEDVKAKTIGKHFSPVQAGKNYFYHNLSKIGKVITKQGYETKQLRDGLSLKKISDKISKDFHAHCVDSWVLANSVVGGDKLDNKKVYHLKPLRFHIRQLHVFLPAVGGFRKAYGGTMSMGFKRGSLVRHKKYGVCYVGGTSKGRISLYDICDGVRLSQVVKVEDCKFLCYNKWLLNK